MKYTSCPTSCGTISDILWMIADLLVKCLCHIEWMSAGTGPRPPHHQTTQSDARGTRQCGHQEKIPNAAGCAWKNILKSVTGITKSGDNMHTPQFARQSPDALGERADPIEFVKDCKTDRHGCSEFLVFFLSKKYSKCKLIIFVKLPLNSALVKKRTPRPSLRWTGCWACRKLIKGKCAPSKATKANK